MSLCNKCNNLPKKFDEIVYINKFDVILQEITQPHYHSCITCLIQSSVLMIGVIKTEPETVIQALINQIVGHL